MVPSNLITVRAYSLEGKERYDIVLVKRSTFYVLQQVRSDFLPCHIIIQYMFVFPTKYLKLLFHRLQRQHLFMAFKRVPRW